MENKVRLVTNSCHYVQASNKDQVNNKDAMRCLHEFE